MIEKSKFKKNICLRISAVLIVVSLLIMAFVTYFHAFNVMNDHSGIVSTASLDLINNINDNIKIIDKFPDLNSLMGEIDHDISCYSGGTTISDIYSTVLLLDENKNCVTRSGNCLFFENSNQQYSLPLEKYLSQAQSTQLYKVLCGNEYKGSKLHLSGTISGYKSEKEIVPTKIALRSTKDTSKEVSFDFDVQVSQDAENFDIQSDKIDWYVRGFGERNKALSKTDIERFAQCDSIALDGLNTGETSGGSASSDIDYCHSYTVDKFTIDNQVYYLAIGSQFFPIEIAIHELILIYILIIILAIFLIAILTFTINKTYCKEKQLNENHKILTNAIAHELKTPLGIIRSFSEGLKEHIAEDKKDHYLDAIINETEKMDTLVLDMLNLSKLEADAYTLKPELFSLRDLAAAEIERFKPLLNQKNIQMKFECDREYPIIADRNGIGHVISNFISNAINHTPSEKNIRITIEYKDKATLFSIENEGENIPEDQLPKVWDSFYKIDSSRDRKEGGSGLGLAIAKSYLKLHKAHYGCENTCSGVRFWFSLKPIIK